MCKRCVENALINARRQKARKELNELMSLKIIDFNEHDNLSQMIHTKDLENLTVAEEVINNLKLNYDKNTSTISDYCSVILG